MPAKILKNYQINVGSPFMVRRQDEDIFAQYSAGSAVVSVADASAAARLAVNGGVAGGEYEAFGGADGGGDGGDGDGSGVSVAYAEDGYADDYADPYADDGFSDYDYVSGGGGGREAPVSAEELELRARKAAAQIESEAKARAEGIVLDAQGRYDDMIEKANREAQGIQEQAKKAAAEWAAAERERVGRENAKAAEEARGRGYQEGIERAKKEYEHLLAEAQGLKEQAERDYQATLAGAEGDAVELVMSVARKVVGEEMQLNPQNILLLIQDAFEHCSTKDEAVLRVSAHDYDYVQANRDVLLSMLEGVGKLEIKKDLSLQPGACFVETPFGSIDAGLQTRLAKVEEAFHSMLPPRGA